MFSFVLFLSACSLGSFYDWFFFVFFPFFLIFTHSSVLYLSSSSLSISLSSHFVFSRAWFRLPFPFMYFRTVHRWQVGENGCKAAGNSRGSCFSRPIFPRAPRALQPSLTDTNHSARVLLLGENGCGIFRPRGRCNFSCYNTIRTIKVIWHLLALTSCRSPSHSFFCFGVQ